MEETFPHFQFYKADNKRYTCTCEHTNTHSNIHIKKTKKLYLLWTLICKILNRILVIRGDILGKSRVKSSTNPFLHRNNKDTWKKKHQNKLFQILKINKADNYMQRIYSRRLKLGVRLVAFYFAQFPSFPLPLQFLVSSSRLEN